MKILRKQQERRRDRRIGSISEVNDQLYTDPTSTKAWLRLGEVHLSNRNYIEALDCFETALSIDSEPAKEKLAAIRNRLGEGDYQRARELLVQMKETGWRGYRKMSGVQETGENG